MIYQLKKWIVYCSYRNHGLIHYLWKKENHCYWRKKVLFFSPLFFENRPKQTELAIFCVLFIMYFQSIHISEYAIVYAIDLCPSVR